MLFRGPRTRTNSHDRHHGHSCAGVFACCRITMESSPTTTPTGNNSSSSITKCKVVVLGASKVGKTCLLARFQKDTFEASHQATVGHDLVSFTAVLLGQHGRRRCLRIQLWDTAERFYSPQHLQDAAAVMIVYSVTAVASWQKAVQWMDTVRAVQPNIPIVLVANQVDMPLSQHQVDAHQALKACQTKKVVLFGQVSAKAGYNVRRLFRGLVKVLVMPQQQQRKTNIPQPGLPLAPLTSPSTTTADDANGSNHTAYWWSSLF